MMLKCHNLPKKEYNYFIISNITSKFSVPLWIIYLEITGGNAAAIVNDLEPLFPVLFESDFDAGGAGVETVLDEFLDGGGEV